jgi:hypothetical protein
VIDWKSSAWKVWWSKFEGTTTNGLPEMKIVGLPDAAVKNRVNECTPPSKTPASLSP